MLKIGWFFRSVPHRRKPRGTRGKVDIYIFFIFYRSEYSSAWSSSRSSFWYTLRASRQVLPLSSTMSAFKTNINTHTAHAKRKRDSYWQRERKKRHESRKGKGCQKNISMLPCSFSSKKKPLQPAFLPSPRQNANICQHLTLKNSPSFGWREFRAKKKKTNERQKKKKSLLRMILS